MSALQVFASGFAAFYALDNAMSAFLASPGNCSRYVWRCVIGVGLSVLMFAAGVNQ